MALGRVSDPAIWWKYLGRWATTTVPMSRLNSGCDIGVFTILTMPVTSMVRIVPLCFALCVLLHLVT